VQRNANAGFVSYLVVGSPFSFEGFIQLVSQGLQSNRPKH